MATSCETFVDVRDRGDVFERAHGVEILGGGPAGKSISVIK